jgi:hypothetical protein
MKSKTGMSMPMLWRTKMNDKIIAFGGAALTVALLPALLQNQPPSAITCVLTVLALSAIGGAYWAEELSLSAISVAITLIVWFGLTIEALS